MFLNPSSFSIFLLLYVSELASGEIYAIKFGDQFYFEEFEDKPAAFGRKLNDGAIRGMLVNTTPPDGCNTTAPPPNVDNEIKNWILLMPRYSSIANCSFEQKVRVAQTAGYDAVIVHNVGSNELITMYASNSSGIFIPAVFVSETSGLMLKKVYTDPKYYVVITGEAPFLPKNLLIPFAIVVGICFIVMIIFMIVKFIKDRRRQRRHRLPTSALNKMPTCKYQKGDPYDTCAICLDDYIEGEKLRVLPCNHVYHSKCIDPWLTKNRRVCPICKRKVFAHDERHVDSDTDSDTDDRTPLINSNDRGTRGGTFDEQAENPIQRAVRSISQQSGAGNFVTASDHHSINGECHSCDSSSTTATTSNEDSVICDNSLNDTLEVHVHNSALDDRHGNNANA